VPCDEFPPTTLVGLTDSAERDGADAAACGVKLRTEENAPVVPAALTPRTRHQSRRLGSEPAVNCDAVTVWLTTNGAENVLESSTWRMYDAAPETSLQSSVTGCAGVDRFAGLRSDGAASRVTVSPAVLATPPRAAVIVTVVEDVTERVVTVNAALVEPATTVTLAGTVATLVLLLESVTTAPPEGAGPLRVTVPCDDTPPVTLVGLRASDDSVPAPAEPGFTVSVAKRPVPKPALMLTDVTTVTADVLIGNVALVAPAATATSSGTLAAGLLLDSATTAPPVGAGLLKVTVPVAPAPAVTLVGLRVSERSNVTEAGSRVNVAVCVSPSSPMMATEVVAATADVVKEKGALLAPAGIVAVAGTVTRPG